METEACREPAVPAIINTMDSTLTRLQERTQSLIGKLKPVMQESCKKEVGADSPKDIQPCEIATTLSDYDDRINGVVGVLDVILANLEL